MLKYANHPVGLHGYSHENPIAMTLEQQTAIMDKASIANPMPSLAIL